MFGIYQRCTEPYSTSLEDNCMLLDTRVSCTEQRASKVKESQRSFCLNRKAWRGVSVLCRVRSGEVLVNCFRTLDSCTTFPCQGALWGEAALWSLTHSRRLLMPIYINSSSLEATSSTTQHEWSQDALAQAQSCFCSLSLLPRYLRGTQAV